MAYVLPWEIEVWQQAGSKMRCRGCGDEFVLGDPPQLGCDTCGDDVLLDVLQGGPGSEYRERPFPPIVLP